MHEIDCFPLQIRLSPLDHLLKRGSLNEGHGHVGDPVDLAELEDLEQGGTDQPGAAFGLATKLGQAVRLSCQGRAQNLESNDVEVRLVPPRLPDISLGPAPQATDEPERAESNTRLKHRLQHGRG